LTKITPEFAIDLEILANERHHADGKVAGNAATDKALTDGREFIAALQVLVYAGAIMVLFLFVLMLLNVRSEQDAPGRGGRTLGAIAVALVALLVAQAGAVLVRAEPGPAPAFDASTQRMAEILFSPQFLYVFEATSILILAALVGAIALAKKDF